MRRLPCLALLAIVSFACAEPPSKEMNQAQGAIDAAKAAGAETYAADELKAAVDALRRSEEAVTQRDYRLALSLAIDSRDRAQTAAKTAVDTRARARGNVERSIAEAQTLLTQARERLRDPDVSRVPRKTVIDVRAVLDAAQKSLQEARTALNRDDYDAAMRATDGVAPKLQTALNSIEDALDDAGARRRR